MSDNPGASWRDGHEGAATPAQFAAGRRVLRAKNNADKWARHDAEAADAQDEATQIRKGGNR